MLHTDIAQTFSLVVTHLIASQASLVMLTTAPVIPMVISPSSVYIQ
jgi:hypothetical protein